MLGKKQGPTALPRQQLRRRNVAIAAASQPKRGSLSATEGCRADSGNCASNIQERMLNVVTNTMHKDVSHSMLVALQHKVRLTEGSQPFSGSALRSFQGSTPERLSRREQRTILLFLVDVPPPGCAGDGGVSGGF